jgi:HEAT repeat protein
LIAAKAVPAAAEMLADTNEGVVAMAAGLLGKFGPLAKDALPGLITVATTAPNGARYAAVMALGQIGSGQAIHVLRQVARSDPNPMVALAARRALTTLKEDLEEDEDWEPRSDTLGG